MPDEDEFPEPDEDGSEEPSTTTERLAALSVTERSEALTQEVDRLESALDDLSSSEPGGKATGGTAPA